MEINDMFQGYNISHAESAYYKNDLASKAYNS